MTTARNLLARGSSPQMPVIVIENCSRADERILRLQLGDLEVGLADCQGPVLVMIGEALATRDTQSTSEDTALPVDKVA